MTGTTPNLRPARPADLAPPAWTDAWRESATRLTLAVPDARGLGGPAMRAATRDLYRDLLQRAADAGHPHVVRIWNHVPGIHESLGEERDRYRVFNAGRFDALCEAFGGRGGLAEFTPAATAVGHDGRDLVVHALATATPGRAVENPDQVPAYRYSARYGRLPPCFARATVVERPHSAVLVAGTAAISGEISCHAGSVGDQLDLTLANLRRLLAASGGEGDLRRFRHVRVYAPAGVDLPDVAAEFPNARVSRRVAELCRAELLVEIEGVAEAA